MSKLPDPAFPIQFTRESASRHHTTAVDFDFNFSTPKLESPLSAELSGNIFAMLARLSSAQSNAQLLVTTVAEHAATSDIVDLLEAHQDNEVTWSRQGKRIHVNVGRGSSPVLQLKGQAYMAPFRGWAASHLHLMKRTAAVPKAEGSLEQVDGTEDVVEKAAVAAADQPAEQEHQLVNLVINIHSDALQQALSNAHQSLHDAQTHSAELQHQVDSLTNQLLSSHSNYTAVSALHQGQTDNHNQPSLTDAQQPGPDAAAIATGTPAQATELSHKPYTNITDTPADAAVLPQPQRGPIVQQSSTEVQRLQQQLQTVHEQAEEAARQQSAAFELVASLQRQLAQQGTALDQECSRSQDLKTQLTSAEQAASHSAAQLARLRSESTQTAQQLDASRAAASQAAASESGLQQQLRKLRAEKQESDAHLAQAHEHVQQLQGLVDRLQVDVATAHQETAAATEALTAFTEQTARLQAAAEVSEQLQAASRQRAHDQTTTIHDLQHRLQDAQSSLHRAHESASLSEAASQRNAEAVQASLDAALAHSQVSISNENQLAETVSQLRSSLAATQAAAVAEAVAHETAVGKLVNQIADLQQQQASAKLEAHEQAESVCELEQKLQAARSSLALASESASSSHATGQHNLQALQQRLDAALQQGNASVSTSAQLSDTVQQLQDRLASAQAASVAEQASHERAVGKLVGQMTDLRQQLASAAHAEETVQQLTERLASAQAASVVEQETHERAVGKLVHQVLDVRQQLASATHADETLPPLQARLASTQAASLAEQVAHKTAVGKLAAQVADLRRQLSSATHAGEAALQLRDRLAEAQAASVVEQEMHEKVVGKLVHQMKTLQQLATDSHAAPMQQSPPARHQLPESSSTSHMYPETIAKLQQKLQKAEAQLQHAAQQSEAAQKGHQHGIAALQGQLQAALEQAAAALDSKIDMALAIQGLQEQLQSAQAEAQAQTEAQANALAMANQQADALQHQLASSQHEAAMSAKTVTSLQEQLTVAQHSATALTAESQRAAAAREAVISSLRQQFDAAQQALQQGLHSAAEAASARQRDIDVLQTRLLDAEEQSTASEAAKADLTAQVNRLQLQLRSAEAAFATHTATHRATAADMQHQVTALQQQLTAVSEAVAAELAGAAAAEQQQLTSRHQALVAGLEQQLHHAKLAMKQQTQTAASAEAELQSEVQTLQTSLADVEQQASNAQAREAQLLDSVTQLAAEFASTLPEALPQSQGQTSVVEQLRGAVQALQQRLTAAEVNWDTAAAHATFCEQQAAAAEASGQQATEAAQWAASTMSQVQADLEGKLQRARSDLVAAQESAVSSLAEKQTRIDSLQQRLVETTQQGSEAHSYLQQVVRELTRDLGFAEAALVADRGGKDASITQLQGQVALLERQLADVTDQAAVAAAAHEAAAHAAALALHQAAQDRGNMTVQHEQALHSAQASYEQVVKTARAEQQHSLDSLQGRLHATTQQLQTLQAQTAAKDEDVAALRAEVKSLQKAAAVNDGSAKQQVADLQQQGKKLQQRLKSMTDAAEAAGTETASLETAVAELRTLCDSRQAEALRAAADGQQSAQAKSDLKAQVTSLQSQTSSLQAQLGEREHSVAELQQRLAEQTRKADALTNAAGVSQSILAVTRAEVTEQLAIKDTLMQQLLDLQQQHSRSQHALHAGLQQQATHQQERQVLVHQAERSQKQIVQLQSDVHHYQAQAESALADSESQQRLVRQLQGQLADAEKQKRAEMDAMQAGISTLTQETSDINDVKAAVALSHQFPAFQEPSVRQPAALNTHQPPANTLSITDVIAHAHSWDPLPLQSPVTPDHADNILRAGHSATALGPLDALLLDAAPSSRPEMILTNPVYLDPDLQASVPPTPLASAPRGSSLQQAELLMLIERQLRESLDKLNATRSQLSEAERQSRVLKQQQEGAEGLVRALRHELHSLRQDTNSVAAGARQTISEKEALQATLESAQVALVEQSELMQQVTAERDILQLQLRRASLSPSSSSPRPSREDSIPAAYSIERNNSQQSVGSASSGKKVKGRLSTASNTSDTASSRRKWAL